MTNAFGPTQAGSVKDECISTPTTASIGYGTRSVLKSAIATTARKSIRTHQLRVGNVEAT